MRRSSARAPTAASPRRQVKEEIIAETRTARGVARSLRGSGLARDRVERAGSLRYGRAHGRRTAPGARTPLPALACSRTTGASPSACCPSWSGPERSCGRSPPSSSPSDRGPHSGFQRGRVIVVGVPRASGFDALLPGRRTGSMRPVEGPHRAGWLHDAATPPTGNARCAPTGALQLAVRSGGARQDRPALCAALRALSRLREDPPEREGRRLAPASGVPIRASGSAR